VSHFPDALNARRLAAACGQRNLPLGPSATPPRPSLLARPRTPGFGASRPGALSPAPSEPVDGR